MRARTKSFLALLFVVWMLAMPAARAAVISEECARELQGLEDELYAGAKCERNDECMETYVGCPFGCGTATRRDFDMATFLVKKKLYENQCGQCAYRCANEAKELMCATGRCRLVYHSEIQQWRDDAKEKERREDRERRGLDPDLKH